MSTPGRNGVTENTAVAPCKTSDSHPCADRSHFQPSDTVSYIWQTLGLPPASLASLSLEGTAGLGLPSSFKVGHLAQSSIALSALAAALVHSVRRNSAVPRVTISLSHAVAEFRSERFCRIDGKPPRCMSSPVGGLHRTSDGYVRIHDGFANHRDGALELLGCTAESSKEEITEAVLMWRAIELETEAFKRNFVMTALRSPQQWDALPQAAAVPDFPIKIVRTAPGPPGLPSTLLGGESDRCLRGLRVLELTRVIAGPVAGRTLAAHGADVLWITSPHLPDRPDTDPDVARGKRTAQLDLTTEADREKLLLLAADADVFIQGYRPGSLAARGFSPSQLAALRPGIIYGSVSAYGTEGPWRSNRGFDSLVQTCSGINVSEAEHFGNGEPSRVLPCQALDHASGYFLAAGIGAALYRRATEGGSYEVCVSLAGTMKYLRSLGQYPGRQGFECHDPSRLEDVGQFLETRTSGLGELTGVRHSARVEGAAPGWDIMPKPLGSDDAEWLPR